MRLAAVTRSTKACAMLDSSRPSVAVLIPCYNEAPTIGKVVADFRRELPGAAVYVYDNNSDDGTAGIAREAGAIVRSEPRQGKGNVVRAMFQDIDADVYLMVDGDDTYPAEAAPEMVRKIAEGYDMVVGDRLSSTYFQENKRPFHNSGNRLVRWTISRMFHSRIRDIMTGYRAMSFTFVKTYPAISGGFELETEMTIHAVDKHVKVYEIPVQFRDRPDGSVSKLSTFADGFKVLATIWRMVYEYRPMPFFTTLAVILVCLGAGLMTPIFLAYWGTGTVRQLPTLIGAGFIILCGVLSFITGIVLDILAEQDRKSYTLHCNEFAYLHRTHHADKTA